MTQTPVQRRLVRTAAGFRSKAIRLGAASDISADGLAQIYLEAGGKCFYCDTILDPFYATFDHVVPFEHGGANTRDNVVLSCLTDNRQKFTMTLEQYREWLALERRCRICQQPFKPRAADFRRGLGFYCSRRCSGTAGGRISPIDSRSHP
jgi:5-methylcytosine-specific restriction endonuclease McrA